MELHILFVLIEPGQEPTQAQRQAAEVYFGRGVRTDSGGTMTLRDMIRETASKDRFLLSGPEYHHKVIVEDSS